MSGLSDQQVEALTRLREPFPPSEIRFLPLVWCGACRDVRGACQRHRLLNECPKCGNRISSAHVDLAYVGHAEATNRLLNVDPAWSWEPVAFDASGLPQFDSLGGLWIRLTVCGVTRLGYGHAQGKKGGDAIKEIIGDAVRNAGMRFGMALDLWTSSDLEIAEGGPKEDAARVEPEQPARRGKRAEDGPWEQSAAASDSGGAKSDGEREAALAEMRQVAGELDFGDGLPAQFKQTFGHPIEQGTVAEFREATALMRGGS